jgi:hypothetical protein
LGGTNSSQDAIIRAIEAASAARGVARRASGDQGFVSQGSLQGFAREDALIGSPIGWQQQQQAQQGGVGAGGAAAGAAAGAAGSRAVLQQYGRGAGLGMQQQPQQPQHLQQQHLDQLEQEEDQDRVEEAVGLSWHAASSSPDLASSPVAAGRHQAAQSTFQQQLAQQALARSRQQQHPPMTRHSS